jgi:hypothetical protein
MGQQGVRHLQHGRVEVVERCGLGRLMPLMRDEFVVDGRVRVQDEKEQNGHHVVSKC